MDSDEEETKEATKGPKFPIQMYISEGNKYFRLGKYETAIEFFNTALQKDPNSESSLVGRARCHMQLGNFVEAKEDAQEALNAHPRSCDAKMLIGEVDYFQGDFEKAFLTFHRGHQSRKNHEGLKLGHQMCKKAIDNTLQPDTAMIFDDQDVADLSKLEDSVDKEGPVEIRIGKDQYTRDVDFVNRLLDSDPDESVISHCTFLKSYLENRQMFWKTQNPATTRNGKLSGTVVKKTNDGDDSDLIDSSYSSDTSKASTIKEISRVHELEKMENGTAVEEGIKDSVEATDGKNEVLADEKIAEFIEEEGEIKAEGQTEEEKIDEDEIKAEEQTQAENIKEDEIKAEEQTQAEDIKEDEIEAGLETKNTEDGDEIQNEGDEIIVEENVTEENEEDNQ